MLALLRPIGLMLLLLLSPLSQAHKVIFDVFTSAGVIEGELGFSSGDMAVNEAIEVLDVDGNRIGQATTDADGFFVYTPSQAIGLVFRADLGAGHVAQVVLSNADVAEAMGIASVSKKSQQSVPATVTESLPVDLARQQMLINEVAGLSLDIKQLRKEITAYKEKNDLQTILGGIGYIFGLFGVAFYVAARRKLVQS